uniref:hypothetical protein n=1 Tax=Roseivirga sp. TaxID=1964215 RepID=UPI0040484FAE
MQNAKDILKHELTGWEEELEQEFSYRHEMKSAFPNYDAYSSIKWRVQVVRDLRRCLVFLNNGNKIG